MKKQEENSPHWGILTELMFNRVQGEVIRHGEYTVVRTPATPDYYFGNLLVLEHAPRNQDRPRLENDFRQLVGAPPLIKHHTFLWPVRGDATMTPDAFIEAGYEFSENTVLIAHPQDLAAAAQYSPEITLRRYRNAADWSDWQALKIAENAGHFPEQEFLRYLAGLQAMYQQMIGNNHGDWWGAFIGDRQVANLGIFFAGDTGRFQAVFTAPSYRNRGICRALVHHVAEHGFGRAARLVMVADQNHHAARLYEKLGFRRRERMASLCRWSAAG
ncbi:acetyltransferase (GNAT) family protein [Collimonas sp. PA-H2]|uniref:GNAT family N-acetyltransferase n=1 Tax=Collimonas sp. PA-H2 TaxID=1881062 RepID=UPI000C007422|nr:GNAT family N-acetyltransferase [Collimonas sp. PA-H2]PFH07764.1 acetyltransferase (GNAT) family protein [Collimonas sp. PA-H2]